MTPILVVDNGPIRGAVSVAYHPLTSIEAMSAMNGMLSAGYLSLVAAVQIMIGAHVAMVSHAFGVK